MPQPDRANPVLTSVIASRHLGQRVLRRYRLPSPSPVAVGQAASTTSTGPRRASASTTCASTAPGGGVAAPEGRRHAVLFTEAKGEPPRMGHYTLDLCRRYGRIGDMRVALDRRPMDRRRFHLDLRHLIDEPLDHLAPALAHRRDHFAQLTRAADGLRAYDVAVFLWQQRHEGGRERAGRARTTRRWNAFLEGHTQARSLSDALPAAGPRPLAHPHRAGRPALLQGLRRRPPRRRLDAPGRH